MELTVKTSALEGNATEGQTVSVQADATVIAVDGEMATLKVTALGGEPVSVSASGGEEAAHEAEGARLREELEAEEGGIY